MTERVLEQREWRYLWQGMVAHLLGRNSMTGGGLDVEAVCKVGPGIGGVWYGTGSQVEYDVAGSLPRCLRCLAKVDVEAYRAELQARRARREEADRALANRRLQAARDRRPAGREEG